MILAPELTPPELGCYGSTPLGALLAVVYGGQKSLDDNCSDSHENHPENSRKTCEEIPTESIRDHVFTAWSEVLGHAEFTDDTQFINAGGQSFKATRMILKLSKRIGHKLPVRLAFDHPTIAELSAAVERRITAVSMPTD